MDNPETYHRVPTNGSTESACEPSATSATPAAEVEIEVSRAATCYASFCRLSGTPEELLIDFGLNPQPSGATPRPVVVAQRIVTGWHTAKRLLQVLQLAVERHEATFGVLETDVRKRMWRA